MIAQEPIYINGDGETSRDFCFVGNAVQANIKAALATSEEARNQVYNIALGDRTTLNNLFVLIRDSLSENEIKYDQKPIYRDFRAGDVRHSLADVSKAKNLLGYIPLIRIEEGIKKAVNWYVKNSRETN
jgi:UDP-N-acetylglucosamine 4-epimerase